MTSMQITDSPSFLSSAVLSPAAKTLRLRIGHPDGRTENIHLESAKITIGSAQGCNLRMDSPGLRPVHCMILRGATGIVVRGWQGPVTVNGTMVEACRVDAGDRLQLGSVTITVLDEPGFATSQLKAKAKRRNSAKPTRRSDHGSELRSLQRIRMRLRRRLRESQAQQRELLKKWRAERRHWLAKFQGEESRFAELEQKTYTWHQALEHQHAALRQEVQLLQSRQPDTAHSTTLIPQVQQLQQLQEELNSARAAWDVERAAQEEAIKSRRRLRLNRLRRATFDLRRQLQDLAARSLILQQEREQWEATKANFEAQQVEETRSLECERAAIDREASRLQGMELDLTQRRRDLETALLDCTEQRNQLELDRSQFAREFADSDARIRSELVSHETAYAALMDHVRELEMELSQLRSASPLAAMASSSEKPDTDAGMAQRQHELESELAQANQTIHQVQETIDNLSREVDSARQRLSEIDRLTVQVDQLIAELADSESRHSQELQAQRSSWETEKHEWAAERSALQAEWDAREQELRSEQQLLQSRSDSLTAKLAESHAELARIQDSLLAFESNADSQSQHAQEMLGLLQNSLAETQARCEELQQQLHSALAELEQRTAQLQEALVAMEQAASANHEDLQGEFAAQLETLDQQMSHERLQWQSRVEELEHRLAALNSMSETWEYEKSELAEAHAERIQQLENHILALQSEIDTLAANSPAEPLPFAGTSSCVKRDDVSNDEQDLIAALLRKDSSKENASQPSISDDDSLANGSSTQDDAAEILARYGFAVSPRSTRHDSQTQQEDESGSAIIDSEVVAAEEDDIHVADDEPAAQSEEDANEQPSYAPEDEGAGDRDSDGDDAITDYMQRLLQRVGNKKSNAYTPESTIEVTPEPAAPTPPVPKPSPNFPKNEADTPPESLTLPPKRIKSEPPANLDAMRALANASTRSAIQTHQVVKEKMKIFLNLGLTAIVVLLATTAMILGRAKMPVLFYFGAASIPFALIFGWQTLRGVVRARKFSRDGERQSPAIHAEEDENPFLPTARKSPNSDDFLGALRAPVND